MCILYRRFSNLNGINSDLLRLREHEKNYWGEVLKGIISTIKLIGKLGLAFKGHDEGRNSNSKGNYLTCLEYLSEFDHFLKLHLQNYGN